MDKAWLVVLVLAWLVLFFSCVVCVVAAFVSCEPLSWYVVGVMTTCLVTGESILYATME